MKIKHYLTVAAFLLTSSFLGSTAIATTTDQIPGATVQDAAFFTGKPYDADLESYVFNYRNYNAEAGRWTTVDPSGFSDGANNQFYAPVPTSSLDPTGLKKYIHIENENSPAIPQKQWSPLIGVAYFQGITFADKTGEHFGTRSGSNQTEIGYTGYSITVSLNGVGFAGLLNPVSQVALNFTINVSLDSNGLFQYSGMPATNSEAQSRADSVAVAASGSITGQGTSDFNLHMAGGYGYWSPIVTGAGINATGGSLNWGTTTYTLPFNLGDYHLSVVDLE